METFITSVLIVNILKRFKFCRSKCEVYWCFNAFGGVGEREDGGRCAVMVNTKRAGVFRVFSGFKLAHEIPSSCFLEVTLLMIY